MVRITVLAVNLGRMGEEREKKKNIIFVVELTTEKKVVVKAEVLG